MAERFSQKNLRVRPSSDEEKIVTNAKKHFEKTLVEISGELVGSVAALEHPTKNKNFCITPILSKVLILGTWGVFEILVYLQISSSRRASLQSELFSSCLTLHLENLKT